MMFRFNNNNNNKREEEVNQTSVLTVAVGNNKTTPFNGIKVIIYTSVHHSIRQPSS